MPFPVALDSTALDALRGTSLVNPTYYASDYAIFCPNTVIFSARVNGAPTGASYAQVAFDTVTVGAYTDIQVGQTVIIGTDPDIRKAEFTGIIRKAPTSSIIYLNETSVRLPDNAYIFAILDFRLIDKLARQVGNTQYKFYDIAYQTTPPLIYGLQTAYADVVNYITNKYTVSCAPLALAITSGATISSWLWSIPSGVTITSGSTTTQNITVTIDSGTRTWITVRATDSNSHQGFFHFFVAAVPFNLSSVITPAVNGITFSANENGYTGSLTAFAGVDDILDNTLCVILSIETYNDVETSINGKVKFVGRIRKENDQTQTDATYGVVEQATYELEGALAQFSRVEHLPFTLRNAASPTVWDQLTNLSIWRAIAYTLFWHTNYLELFSLSFDSHDNTYLYPLLPTQGGNIQAVINDLQTSIDATLESAATGETRIYRNALYLTTAQRNALVTVIDFTQHDWIEFNLDIVEVDAAGKVQASGGYFNPNSGVVTPLLSLAPGIAQATGAEITNLPRQVLAATTSQINAQAELNTRSGNHFAIVQREQPVITVTHPDGYTFITPSRSQWYTFTIAASENTGGRAFTTADRWQCLSVSVTHDSGLGTNEIQATYQLESEGTPGQTVTYPPQGTISPVLPTIPPIPAFPSLPPLPIINLPPDPQPGDTPPYQPSPLVPDGNLLALISDIDAWNTSNALVTSLPAYSNISPATALTFTCFQWVGMGYRGAYLLGNDGVDTTIFYSEDATVVTPAWVGTVVSGVYTSLRPTSTGGQAYAIGQSNGCTLYDFTVNDGGWTAFVEGGGYTVGVYTPGVGWQSVYGHEATYDNRGTYIQISGFTSITSVSVDYVFTAGADTGIGSPAQTIQINDDSGVLSFIISPPNGSHTFAWSGTSITTGVLVQGRCGYAAPYAGIDPGGEVTFTSITICGVGGTGASTIYTVDFASTFASPVSVGTPATADPAMDTVKVGNVVLAVTDTEVLKATSGGAYSSYSTLPAGFVPTAIWIPFFAKNSTSVANSSTNPDYVIASNVADGTGATMYFVDTAGANFVDISPTHSAVAGIAVSSNCISMPFKSGKVIASVLSYSGTRRLQVSTNAGTSWTDFGSLAGGAQSVRFRRSDTSTKQLFIGDGATGLEVSQNGGTTLLSKTNPSSDACILVEVFG